MNMHIRDVPEKVHRELARRAAARGQSLRKYVIELLEDHCRLPTMDEWLDDVERLGPAFKEPYPGYVAEQVRLAREEDDDEILRYRDDRP